MLEGKSIKELMYYRVFEGEVAPGLGCFRLRVFEG